MPRKRTAKPKALPAAKPPKRRGCLTRLLLWGGGLLALYIVVSVLFAAGRSAGEAAGLLPTRTPTPTATITPVPTATPVPTHTPQPTATTPPSAAVLDLPPDATPALLTIDPIPGQPTLVAGQPLVIPVDPTSAPTDPDAALTLVTWNLGLDDADPAVIAERLAAFQDVDLWALQEFTEPALGDLFEMAAESGEGDDFDRMLGRLGRQPAPALALRRRPLRPGRRLGRGRHQHHRQCPGAAGAPALRPHDRRRVSLYEQPPLPLT